MVQVTLKKVWNMAISVAADPNHVRKVSFIKFGQHISRMKKRTEPKVLNIRWISPARFALAPDVKEDISAVTQEPMFVPRMM